MYYTIDSIGGSGLRLRLEAKVGENRELDDEMDVWCAAEE